MPLLQRQLIDLRCRSMDALDQWNKIEPSLPPEAKQYAEGIRTRLLERARNVVEAILNDPDLPDPAFARTFYNRYKRVVELIQRIEEGPLLVVSRYGPSDRFASLLVARIAGEMGYPATAPLCSATSTQYYFADTGLDLIFVPCTEPYRLLGLADLYHELAHFLLFRLSNVFLDPVTAAIDQYFDQAVKDARQKGWVQALIDELEEHRRSWKRDWRIEFGSDMVATFCAGPAYGWANVRLCSNMSADLYGDVTSHPADAARQIGINLVLKRIGFGKDANDIEAEWNDLLGLTTYGKPQGFDMTYPVTLLQQFADEIINACKSTGLQPYSSQAPGQQPAISHILNAAWREFHANPDTYTSWEQKQVAQLKQDFSVP